MISLVICDDNPQHNQTMTYHIRQMIHLLPAACEVALVTTDKTEVLDYAKKAEGQTIYLLDIVMDSETAGIDVCREIHQYDQKGYIIYVSAYAEYALECCQSHSFDFVLKPYTEQRLENALRDVIQEIMKHKPVAPLSITAGSITQVLDQREIIYFKSQREYVTAFSTNGQVTWRESMTRLMTRVDDECFLRIHKSYMINKLYLRMVDTRTCEATLRDDIILPVSRRRIRKLAEKI